MMRNIMEVKINNRRLVKKAISVIGAATKNDVCRQTGLSFATCNTLINELVEAGELLTLSENRTNIGRPSTAYMINYEYGYLCGMVVSKETEGFSLRILVENLNKEIICDEKTEAANISYEILLEKLQKTIAKYKRILEIGVSIGGVVNRGNEIFSIEQPALNRCNLSEKLSADLRLPVFTENNMNIVAYGAWSNERYMEYESIAVFNEIKGNCGGAGFVQDGQVLHGSNNFAGETGFLPFAYASYQDQIVRLTATYTAILNPECVIVFGEKEKLATIDIEETERKICEFIPKTYCPRLFFTDEAEKEELLTAGLMELCLRGENL